MKKALVLLFLIAAFEATAQTDTTKTKAPFLKFLGVRLVSGGFFGSINNTKNDALANLENVAGGPNTNFFDIGTNYYNYYGEYNNTTLWANFLVRSNKTRMRQTLSAGLNYYKSNSFGFGWSSGDRYTVDTLFSNTNHTYALVDTIYDSYKGGSLLTDNLMGHVGYSISSNPARKVSFFGSVNIGIGGTITSQYRFNNNNYGNKVTSNLIDTLNPQTDVDFNYYANYFSDQQNQSSTTKKVPGYFVVKPYITAGISYRLSKKIPVLKSINITLEYRIGSQHLFFKNRVYSGFSRGAAIGLSYTVPSIIKTYTKRAAKS
jgi:hypothetical protein